MTLVAEFSNINQRGFPTHTNVYAVDRFIKLGGVKVRTCTVNGSYELPTDTHGTFALTTIGTIFDSYEFQALPYQAYYQYAGTATNGGTGAQGTLPKYRFYTSLDWRLRLRLFGLGCPGCFAAGVYR